MLGHHNLSLVVIFIGSAIFSLTEFNFSVDLALLGRFSAFFDYAYGCLTRMLIVGSATS